MARPQVADGGNGFQIWRVAANILNKQLRTADKGDPPVSGLGMELTSNKYACYERSKEPSDRNDLSEIKWI
jgi:hypothetical protein